ncbi:MAG: cation-translocating P-type ATPase [Candidatus Eremiobacteraeota bacterium]|nr:cation-translocating P-type ATPase [Candidatus Eremiobacteraeota bacterium]
MPSQAPETTGTHWHCETVDKALELLGASTNGLDAEEAARRLAEHGPNEFASGRRVSKLLLLLSQFTSLLVVILIISAVISLFLGQYIEAIAIIVIVLLAGFLGFLQEYQAGKAIESLKRLAAPTARVIRGGSEKEIPSREVVPGDIILLKTGDMVPADGRLTEAINLKVGEAVLTGESMPEEKHTEPIADQDLLPGDRKNMVHMGTTTTSGRGRAAITATGMGTEFGKIAGLLNKTERERTPLQKNLDTFGKWLGIFAIALSAATAVLGIFRGHSIIEMFIWGVALAVAVIPEALPAVVNISLAIGVRRLVKHHALIRKLAAVETLGATTVICSDKTGTLTQDEMTVRMLYMDGRTFEVTGAGYSPKGEIRENGALLGADELEYLKPALVAGALCNDTILQEQGGEWKVVGDPTEGAFLVLAKKAGIDPAALHNEQPRTQEIPFTSERKRMTTVHTTPEGIIAYSKGAYEVLLDGCSRAVQHGKAVPLTDEIRREIARHAGAMAGQALRVLALAYRSINAAEDPLAAAETGMVFIGIAGMSDPPRPEAREALARCTLAGIRPVMITGDNMDTAVAVAKELGLLKRGCVLTGAEISAMPDDDFDKSIGDIEVYARISPEHKLRIVNALMKKGEIVVMTGDGVNDAPALKRAHIGVAMGITGTDVSKEASDMILIDDNFASIVAAVEEGRSIFDNIRKYLVFLLSGNLATVVAMIVALIAELPLPLVAVQILFINLIMDGLVAIALGVDPPQPGIMERRPRNVKEGIIDAPALYYIAAVGIWIALVTLGPFLWALHASLGPDKAMSIFFATLIFARIFNGFNCRSREHSLFTVGFFGNRWLWLASLVSAAFTLLLLYLTIFHAPFKTVPLGLNEWMVVLPAAFSTFVAVELWKLGRRLLAPVLRH